MKDRLDALLGTKDWYDAFYEVTMMRDLFGDEQMMVQKASMDAIGRFFMDRLRCVFAGVADRPGVLMNSKGNPLYLLCFAVGNKRACGPALRIANHLLEGMR